MAEEDDNQRDGAYQFTPAKGPAIVFLVLFSLLFIAHLWQAVRLRTVWVWPLIVGLVLEVVGYATRYANIVDDQVWSAIVTQVAIIVAPAFMAAMIYMCAGRMIAYLGSEYSPISHNVITKVFVIADFLSILTQGGAGGLLSSDNIDTLKAGFNILIGALAFQVLILFIFISLFFVFDKRTRVALGNKREPMQRLFWVFYVAAILILLRSMYRLAEFASVNFTLTGPEGYLVEHEWPLFIFDALPVAFCMIALSVVHPGSFLPTEKGLRIDGTYEAPSNRVCGCLWVSKSARRVRPEALEMSQPHADSSARHLSNSSPV